MVSWAEKDGVVTTAQKQTASRKTLLHIFQMKSWQSWSVELEGYREKRRETRHKKNGRKGSQGTRKRN